MEEMHGPQGRLCNKMNHIWSDSNIASCPGADKPNKQKVRLSMCRGGAPLEVEQGLQINTTSDHMHLSRCHATVQVCVELKSLKTFKTKAVQRSASTHRKHRNISKSATIRWGCTEFREWRFYFQQLHISSNPGWVRVSHMFNRLFIN